MRARNATLLASIGANIALLFLLFRGDPTSLRHISAPSPSSSYANEGRLSPEFPYLSKRIFAEHQNDILINFSPLRSTLREYIKNQSEAISLYFEYLPSGTSIGINDNESFYAASLLKLPTAMRAQKLIMEGNINSNQELSLEEKHIDRGFGNLWQRGVGTKIPVEEVIRLSIAESDNTAHKMLRDLVGDRPVSEVFDYLDIPTDTVQGTGAGVTPKNFSSVLRSLYLAAYLPRDESNRLLKMMTTSPFKNRIVAGVPTTIEVAHKVGIFKPPTVAGETHSDCGIVYVPSRPYLLCIMTNAAAENADRHMQTLSKEIYQYVHNARGG